jgi:aminopeptidase N
VKYIGRYITILYSVFFISNYSCSQPLNKKGQFDRQDTLRGTITPERAWWDVASYHIFVEPDFTNRSVSGWNDIAFDINSDGSNRNMQIDLQQPMQIDSIIFNKKKIKNFKREGNVYLVDFGNFKFTAARTLVKKEKAIPLHTIRIYFHGKPVVAKNPPWDGGWIFTKDAEKNPWMTVACQGLGASVWYPCKDHQSDEPDLGATIQVKVPKDLVAVANGKMGKTIASGNKKTWTWEVKNPINNYNIVPYIGKYVQFGEKYQGEKGTLDLDYWVLSHNMTKAQQQFDRDVKPMLKCFEYWFGPYPFYEDGFKLVESPHLGMEHQSAIAYGNHYRNGYLGMDLSGSGWGNKWDYIIIHESGHEWFGNNITTKDIADMWVHEGFTMYSEVLFVECQYGKNAGDEYLRGIRKNIDNDIPLIGPYGVNREGSGDMYNKGASLIHTVRQVINDDSLFRKILRGLNKDFWHKTVTSKDVEEYISKNSGRDLSKVFEQYLRTIKIPVLEYKVEGDKISYRWNNCVAGFDLPVQLERSGERLKPTTEWQHTTGTAELIENFSINKNFYITTKKIN